MTEFYKFVRPIFFAGILLVLGANIAFGQCTITNLNSSYCSSDAAVTLAPGSLTYYRTGSGSAITQFNPSIGAGTYTVVGVNPAVTTYNVVTGGTFNRIIAAGTPVALTNTSDVQVAIPFTFNFFGTGYTQVRITSNGYLKFGAASNTGTPAAIPAAGAPNDIIAGVWDDFDPSEGGTVQYFTTGVAPYRIFVVDYDDVDYNGASTNSVTFQIQLYESTNKIEIHSTDVQSDGGTRTQGIENSAGTAGYASAARNNLNWTATNDYIAFVPTCLDTRTVTINANPTPVIAGLTTVCALQSGVGYSVTAAANRSYSWTVVGGTITAGAGTDNITVTWSSSASGTVRVVETNTLTGCSTTTGVYNVTINANPVPVISGLNTVCENQVVTYSSASAGPTYDWTVTGATSFTGDGTNTISVTWGSAGAGTVQLQESNANCTVTTGLYTVTINANPTPVIAGLTTVCALQSGVGYSVTAAANRSYSWTVVGGTITAGAGTDNITVTWSSSASGTVRVVETNTLTGCSTTTGVYNVTINANPVPVISGLNTVCENQVVTYSSASAGPTYDWTVTGATSFTGDGTNTISVTWGSAGAGTVQLQESNANCTVTTGLYTVTINANPTPVIAGLTTVCALQSGVGYSVTAAANRSYSWTVVGGTITAGAGTDNITVTWSSSASGTVRVVETNTLTGCSTTTGVYNVTINANPVPVISGLNTVCENQVVTYSSASAGPTYDWTVTGATSFTGDGTNTISVTWGSAGAGTVQLQESNANCTVTTGLYTVTINANPTPVIAGLTTVCALQSGVGYSVTAAANRSYSWTVVGGTITAGAGTDNITVTWSSSASGTVRVVETNTLTGCSTTTGVYNVTINANPVPVISGLNTVCENQVVTYSSASAGPTYDWTVTGATSFTGDGTNTISVTWGSAGAGTVQLQESNANCTVTTGLYTVTINANPTPVIAGLTTVCALQSGVGYSVTAAANRSYSWTVVGGTITAGAGTDNITVTWSSSASGTVRVVETNTLTGCSTTTGVYNVTINANPVPVISGLNTVCENQVVTYSSASAGPTYDWTVTGATSFTGDGTNTISVTWGSAGAGTVQLQESNANCTVTTGLYTVTINANPTPVIAGLTTVCALQSGVGYSVTAAANRSYSWTVVGGTITAGAGTDNITVTWSSSASGTVRVVETNTLTGCSTTTGVYNVTINANPVPVISGLNTVCENQVVTYSSASAGPTYDWTVTGATSFTGDGTNTISVTWGSAGAGTVQLQESNANCTVTTGLYTVTINANPTPVIAGLTTVCALQSGVGYSVTAAANRSYSWTVVGGTITAGAGTDNITVTWSSSASGTVRVVETNTLTGCSTTTGVYNVTINANPVPVISGLNTVCENQVVTYSSASAGPTYDWTVTGATSFTGDGTNTISVTWGSAGAGTVQLQESNANCTVTTGLYTVTINANPTPVIAGLTTVCALQSGVGYSVTAAANRSYSWTVVGGTITAGAGTDNITVTWSSSASGTVRVVETNTLTGCSTTTGVYNVTINANPVPVISGLNTVCENQVVTYSSASAGPTYDWTVTGATSFTGDGTNTISVTWGSAGAGTVQLQESNANCTVTTGLYTVTINANPTPVIAGLTTVCALQSGVGYSVTAAANRSYSWTVVGGTITAGAGTDNITVTWSSSASGTVRVVETNTLTGCSTTTGVYNVTINANPVPVISGLNTVCENQVVTYSSASAGPTYDWTVTGATSFTGDGTNTISVTWGSAGAGTVQLQESNANCTVTTGLYTVTINANPTPVIAGLTTVCALQSGVGYSVTAAANRSYSWTVVGGTITAGAGTDNITVTWSSSASGTVRVVETNTLTGCSTTTGVYNVTINANPVPVISGLNTVCENQVVTYSSASAGPTYDWTVTGATSFTGDGTNTISVTWGSAGAGTVQLQESNANCTVTTGLYTVTINANPTPVIAGLTTVCALQSGVGYSVTAAANRSYSWTVVGGTITAGAGTDNITVTWSSSASGTVRVVETNTLTGCSTTTGVYNVTINANPVPVISGLNTVCENQVVTYSSASAGPTYDWTVTGATSFTGDGTNTISVTWGSAGAGTVQLQESNANCTVTTGLYTVTINANPTPVIAGLTTVCALQSGVGYSVTAAANRSYSWTVVGGTITAGAGTDNITVTWSSSASGTVRVVETNTLTGCSTTTGVYNVTINANPVPVISGLNTVCENQVVTYSSASAGPTYDWTVTGATSFTGDGTNTISVTWGSAGAGTVQLQESNANCTVTTGLYTVTINANPTPVIAGLTTVCALQSGVGYSVTAAANRSYSWTVVGGTITAGAGTDNITVTWSSSASGTVRVVETNTLTGCSTTTGVYNVTINANPVPVISGLNTVCENQVVTYSSASAGPTYDWTVTGATSFTGDGTNTISVTWGSAGAGTVQLQESNANCTVTTGLYTVTINANPTPVIAGLTTVCALQSGVGYSVTAAANRSYSWTVVGGTITAGAGTDNITVTWSSSASGTVRVVETNTLTGCSTTTGVYNVTINANPVPVISGLNTVCENQVVTYSSASAGPTYDWTVTGATSFTGDGTNTISVTWGSAGAGTVQLQESNANCTVTTGLYTVTINANPTPVIAGLTTVCALQSGVGYSVTAAANRSYSWTVVGGTITAGAGTDNITVTWSSSASGTVRVVETNTLTGCSTTTGVYNVTINANPVPVISGLNTVCENQVVTYSSASAGPTYDWTVTGATSFTGDGTNTISVTWGSAGAGTVQLQESNANCTVTTGLYTVTINANPTPVIAGLTTVCALQSGVGYSVTAAANRSYSWTVVGGTITAGAGTDNITVTWSSSASGTVRVVETNTLTGCSTTTGVYNVTIDPMPVFSIANTTPALCEGVANPANITLTSPTAGAVMTLSGINYNGVTGSSNYSVGATFTTGQQITETYSNPGNTPLTVTYTFSVAANGCSNPTTQQTTVTVNPDATFSIANTTAVICEGAAANITLTSPTTNAIITLTTVNYNGATGTYVGGETFTTGQKITETLINPTESPILVTYTFGVAANGCSNPTTQQTTVTVNPAPPVFSLANTTPALCEGASNPANITLTSPTAGAVMTLSGINYNGVTGSSNYSVGATFTTGQQITETYSNPGNAPLTVTYTFSVAANGCSNPTTQQTTVTVNPDATFSIANTTAVICEGAAANITLTSPTTNAIITLTTVNYNGATGTYVGGETFTTGQKITETLINPTESPILVTYTFGVAANGCSNPTTQQTTVTVNPAPPVFSLTNTTPALCEGASNPANITLTSPTAGAVITLSGINYNGVTGSSNYSVGATFTTGQQITETYSNPGNAPLTVTYTFSVAANSCSNPTTQQTTVTVNPDVVFSITNTTAVICEGAAANITLTSPITNAVMTLASVNYNGASGGTYSGLETFTTGQKITETLGNPTESPITVTYEFTVSANGCSDLTLVPTTITINPAPPVFSIANTTPSLCEGLTNPANITLTSPTAGAVMTLSGINYNGVTGSSNYSVGATFTTGQQITETYSNPGNAPLTVTYTFSVAANGCSNPTTQQTTVTVNPDATFSIANTTAVICEGAAANITLTSPITNAVMTLASVNYNGASGGTYSGLETFTTGQKIAETLGNPTESPITVTYEFTVSANGCSDLTLVPTTITINPAPPVFSIANTTPSLCEGLTNPANITLTSPTAGAVITLSGINYNGVTGSSNYSVGATFTTGQQITETYSNPGNTPLTVTYTFSVAANSCSNPTTQQTTVTVNPDVVFSITNTTAVICEGAAANITLTSPITNAVMTLASVNYNGASGGTYSGLETFTTGQKIAETLGNPTESPITVTYEFTVSANGCSDLTLVPTTITINPAPPVFSIANTTPSLCEGLTNPANITLTSPTAGAVMTLSAINYNGVTGSSNYSVGATFTTGQQITETYSNPGNTPLTVTYTFSVAANGCSNPTTQQTTVAVNPDPVFNINNTTAVICEGTAANIMLTSLSTNAVITLASVNYNGASGTYLGGETFTSGQKITETLVNPTESPIIVTYTFSVAANGCSNPTTQQTTVTVNPAPPVFSITNTIPELCEGVTNPANITLTSPTANAVITLTGINYNGVTGSSNYSVGATFTTGQQITETYSNPSNLPRTVIYTFSVAANGCSNPTTQQTSVAVSGTVSVSVPSSVVYVCEPNQIDLLGSVGGSATTGAWSKISGAGTISVSSVTEIVPITLPGSRYDVEAVYSTDVTDVTNTVIFRLSANDPSGFCPSQSTDINVTINQAAVVNAGTDFAICEYDTIQLDARTGGSTTSTTWDLVPTGTFENVSDTLSKYFLSGTQKSTDDLVLTFTIRAPDPDGLGASGPCGSVSDQVTVTVNDTTNAIISGINSLAFYAENGADIPISGFPSGGFFTGPGVNTATSHFEPSNADLVPAVNVVVYHYTDPITGCISRPDTIARVNPLTFINFDVDGAGGTNDFPEICANTGNVLLDGNPDWDDGSAQTAFFYSPDIPGRIIFSGSDYFIKTNGLPAGNYIIGYSFTNTGNVTTAIEHTLTVHPAPKAIIDVVNSCVADSITFIESSFVPAPGSLVRWDWDFGNTIGSINNRNPEYKYPVPGSYPVTLRVTTDKFCFHDSTKVIRVGDVPAMKFSWTQFCKGDSTQFVDQTVAAPSNIINYAWDFGESGSVSISGIGAIPGGTNGGRTEGTYKDPSHEYLSFQVFPVTLTVLTDDGCQNSLTRQVFIQDNPAVTTITEYFENFDNDQGTWVSTLADETIPTYDTSWVWGLPFGKGYQTGKGYIPKAGTNGWYTGANDSSYYDNEKTALIGPCLDLTGLSRPMVSIDYWSDLDNRQDGMALQYSTTGGIVWHTIGDDQGAGINWYSAAGINGFINPVIQPSGYGWTGESFGWKTARYNLDAIPDSALSQVIFRFLLGTNSDNTPGTEFSGIAIDNIYIGEKKRNVMLEYFTNNPATLDTAYLNGLNPEQFLLPDESDFFRIQYHLANPGADAINQENPVDPAARALYYGVSRPPRIIMDGILGRYFSKAFTGDLLIDPVDIDRRSLENPLFDLQIDTVTTTGNALKAWVKYTYVDTTQTLANDVIINVGLVEDSVGGSPLHRNVLRKLLLGTDGRKISPPGLLATDSIGIDTLIDASIGNSNKRLYLVAFVQDRNTKRIHQATMLKLGSKSQTNVVGIEDPVLSGAKEIQIFPNPASRQLNFTSEQKLMQGYVYSIVDQRGITMIKGELKEDIFTPQQVELNNLSNGVYFVIISRGGRALVHRKIAVMNKN